MGVMDRIKQIIKRLKEKAELPEPVKNRDDKEKPPAAPKK